MSWPPSDPGAETGLLMGNLSTPASRRLIAAIKRAAKDAARSGAETHSSALERLAREHGHASWDALLRTAASVRRTPGGLPIDPSLPDDFDSTPNEARSKAQLDRWWNRPYVLTRGGEQYEVRCLDGGAWDRSTWYGCASTLEEADAIAAEKLKRWQDTMSRPSMLVGAGGRLQVVLTPSRPDRDFEVLYDAKDSDDARRFIEESLGSGSGGG